MNDAFNHARAIAVSLLNMQTVRTPDVIRAQAKLAVLTTRAAGLGEVDVEALIAQLVQMGNVTDASPVGGISIPASPRQRSPSATTAPSAPSCANNSPDEPQPSS